MKKILFLCLFLFLSFTLFSQNFSKVLVASKSEWNGTEWKTISSSRPTDMFIIIKDWDITVGTYKFKTYDDPEKTTYESHVCYSWKCVNGNGEKCVFMMKKFRPEVSTHMLYSIVYETGIMYEYETEE